MSLSPAAERLLRNGAVTVLRKRALKAAATPIAGSSLTRTQLAQNLIDPSPKRWQTKMPKKIRRAKDPKAKMEERVKAGKSVAKQLEDKRKKESALRFKPREMIDWLKPNFEDKLRVSTHRQMLSTVQLNTKKSLSTLLNVALFRTQLHTAAFPHVSQSSHQSAAHFLKDNVNKLQRISARAGVSIPDYRVTWLLSPPQKVKAASATQQKQKQKQPAKSKK